MDKYLGLTVFAILMLYLTEESLQQGILEIITPAENKTVKTGQTVAFSCIFNREVECSWARNDLNIKVDGRYKFRTVNSATFLTTDCTIEISDVKDGDFGSWSCSTPVTSDMISSPPKMINWLSKEQTPTPPKIFLNGKESNQIVFPISTDEEFILTCSSNLGNPATKLSWELDNTIQDLYQPTITRVDTNSYNVSLIWDQPELLENRNNLRCVANHPGFPDSLTSKIEITQKKPTSFVNITTEEPHTGHSIVLESHQKVRFICVADGEPKPEIVWEISSSDGNWTIYANTSEISVGAQDNKFRCKAINIMTREWIISKDTFVVRRKQPQEGNFGAIIGIVIACLIITLIAVVIVIYLYRRKKWFFAPKASAAATNVDGEVGEPDNDRTTEKTPFSETHQESQYENVKTNGKEEEINGKPDSSPLKNDQNDNKNPPEVVYAQLDLSTQRNQPVKPPPEYQKTEYAEIQFNKDQHNHA